MSLIRSWYHSLTLLLPQRLLPLLGRTFLSMGNIYRHLGLFFLLYGAAQVAMIIYFPPTPDGMPLSVSIPQFLLLLIPMILGSILPILIFLTLLPSNRQKNIYYYLRTLRSYWLVLLLPLLSSFISLPFIVAIALVTTFIEKIRGGTSAIFQEESTSLIWRAAEPPNTEFHVNVFGYYSCRKIGQEALTLATTTLQLLILYINLVTLFYLSGKTGFGNGMRALWHALRFLWQNLPFFAFFIAIRVIILANTNFVDKLNMFSSTSTEAQIALLFVTSFIMLPFTTALTVQIYNALMPNQQTP